MNTLLFKNVGREEKFKVTISMCEHYVLNDHLTFLQDCVINLMYRNFCDPNWIITILNQLHYKNLIGYDVNINVLINRWLEHYKILQRNDFEYFFYLTSKSKIPLKNGIDTLAIWWLLRYCMFRRQLTISHS